MQEEDKMSKSFKIDISKSQDPSYYKKLFIEIINESTTKQKAFFCSLPTNVDLPGLFKTLDQPTVFLESEDVIKSLFYCAEVCNKPFPFSLFLLDWNNKRAQLSFISNVLDKKIDLGSSSGLSKIIKPDYITDSVYYLNSVELFKCIAGLNNRSLIMKIKQECPEMCVLGLSHVLPKFSDIFDELFLKTIEKYRHLNNHYGSEKSSSSQSSDLKNSFYSPDIPYPKSTNLFTNPPSIIIQAQREELKIIEKQSYILNILLIQKKVIHKLSLVPLNVALHLIVENNCFEQVLSLNSELSYNILILGYQTGLFDLRTVLIFRVKNDLFIHNLLVYLMGRNIEVIIPVINALSMAINSLKPDTLVLFAKLKEKIDNHYLFLPFSASNFHTKFENEVSGDQNDARTEKYVYPKYINEKIYKFPPENIDLIESSIKANNNYRLQTVEKNLEPFKNIQKLKKIFKGTVHQRNFVNKLATYFINALDPFVEELYEEGLLCENQAKIAAKIISFYKSKKNKLTIEIKRNDYMDFNDLGLESLDRMFINTYDNLFQFKIDNFSHENMFKYITNHLLMKDWLSIVEFCYELKSEIFIENFVLYLFAILRNYIKKLNESVDKREKTSDSLVLNWFIHSGLVLSELICRQNKFVSVEIFDFKNAIQKSCILVSHEIIYFVAYFFLNSKNIIFTGKSRYLRKILHELMAYKEDLPFIKINLDLKTVLEKNSVEEKSAFNFYLLEETTKRLAFFNENYTQEDSIKRILADYYQFIYLPSNVVCKSEYLANYVLPDNVYSSIIQMAIDVSVRDVCKTLVERIIKAVEKSIFEIQKLYSYKNVHNAFLNLATRLIQINSYEPLTGCIKNNIINFLKLCNLDINKISITQILDSNLEICYNLLKREIFTKINSNKYYKERNIFSGKNSPNVDILNNLITYEPIIIKELKDEDLEKIKSKLTGITRDIPNTKLYVLTEQWRNFVSALEAYEHFNNFDDLDAFMMEESIAKSESYEKDIKQCLKELTIKDAIERNAKPKENPHPDVIYFFDYKQKKDTLISHSKALISLLVNSDQIDSLSETLCKHVIGYLQYRVLHFMFLFLNEIFTVSFYSYLTVKHYFLYANLPFSKLVYYSLENRIIPILEFDQLTALDKREMSQKVMDNEVERLKSILNILVPRNKKLFTIYDFVYILERISKHNSISFVDHMVVNLKGFNLNESQDLFEEFIRNNRLSHHKKIDFIDFVRIKKADKIKQVISLDPSEENAFLLRELYNAFYYAWDHFLKYHRKQSDYSFYKIDTLIDNCKENYLLMEVLSDFVESSTNYDNYIFYKFLNRALGKFFVKVDKLVEFRKLSDESNPFLIFLRGLIQIPQYVFFLFEYSPQSLKYAALVIDLINLTPSLLNYAVAYFTDLYLYSLKGHALSDDGRLEINNLDGTTKYKFIPEDDENIYLQSLQNAFLKTKIVMNKNFEYIKVRRQHVLICKCRCCEEINHNNPLLMEESDNFTKKEYNYRNKGYSLEDIVNPLEILERGCKKYFAIFSYLVHPKYPELKNLFMTTYIPNNESLKKIDYFKIRNLLNKNISAWAYRKYKGYIVAVVDSLYNNYFDEIHLILKEKFKVIELVNCLQARASCFNAPLCITKALEIVDMSNLVKK